MCGDWDNRKWSIYEVGSGGCPTPSTTTTTTTATTTTADSMRCSNTGGEDWDCGGRLYPNFKNVFQDICATKENFAGNIKYLPMTTNTKQQDRMRVLVLTIVKAMEWDLPCGTLQNYMKTSNIWL